MELTIEYLKQNGYTTNHPDRVLARYYKSDSTQRVSIEPTYVPLSDAICYNIECWSYNTIGAVIKKSSVSYATTVEELNECIQLARVI